MIDKDTVYIIGYTLDATLIARELAEKKNLKVIFLNTGILGHPLDDIGDYITHEDMIRINALDVITPFKKLSNSTYAFIPYNELKFVNNRNGLISYPLNKSSFDSAEEWEQVEYCILEINKFREKLEQSSNFINIYKNFFPKWLYDSMLKYMGVSKWGDFRQSKFTRDGLAKEIDLSYLDVSNTGTMYAPVNGYNQLCKEILNHPNITLEDYKLKDVNNFLRTRFKNADVIVCDNRIDYICNYTYGNFDRVVFETEKTNETNLEEFFDISEGIVLTPTKDYWCITKHQNDITKIRSRYIDDLSNNELSVIAPTITNKKIYSEYQKLISLYSDKILYLSNNTITFIK
jgi:UDP-galactopyranose mutase